MREWRAITILHLRLVAEGDVIEIDRGVCAAERAEHPTVVIGRTASYEGLVGHGDEVGKWRGV